MRPMGHLCWICLPSAALLRRIILTKDFVVEGSGKDLASYYFCLLRDKRWHRRNAVGKRVAQSVVRKYKEKYVGKNFDGRIPMRLVVLVAGMGDQNTVDVASAVHLNVLSDAGLLPPAELRAHDRPVPTTVMWTGVYIDDWLLVSFVRRADAKKPGPRFCSGGRGRRLQSLSRRRASRGEVKGIPPEPGLQGLGRIPPGWFWEAGRPC